MHEYLAMKSLRAQVTPLLIWPCAAGDCRSFTVRIEQKALAVDHLPVLRDRHVMQERPSASISLIACGIVSGYSPPCDSWQRKQPPF